MREVFRLSFKIQGFVEVAAGVGGRLGVVKEGPARPTITLFSI